MRAKLGVSSGKKKESSVERIYVGIAPRGTMARRAAPQLSLSAKEQPALGETP